MSSLEQMDGSDSPIEHDSMMMTVTTMMVPLVKYDVYWSVVIVGMMCSKMSYDVLLTMIDFDYHRNDVHYDHCHVLGSNVAHVHQHHHFSIDHLTDLDSIFNLYFTILVINLLIEYIV